MFDLKCPRCGRVHHSEDKHIGRFLKCDGCGDPVQIINPHDRVPPSGEILVPSRTEKQSQHVVKREEKSSRSSRVSWSAKTILLLATMLTGVWILWPLHEGSPKTVGAGVENAPLDGQSAQTNTSSVSTEPDLTGGRSGSRSTSPPIPVKDRSLPNGAILEHKGRGIGLGTLKIENNSYDDALVTISGETNQPRYRVYIDHDRSFILKHLPPGLYSVVFTTGRDWTGQEFTENDGYLKFGKKLSFDESQETDGTRYRAFEITLQPAPNGTVEPIKLTKEEYFQLVGLVPLAPLEASR